MHPAIVASPEDPGGTGLLLEHAVSRPDPTRASGGLGSRAMVTVKELFQELNQEAQTTRRVLERVPEAKLEWRPVV